MLGFQFLLPFQLLGIVEVKYGGWAQESFAGVIEVEEPCQIEPILGIVAAFHQVRWGGGPLYEDEGGDLGVQFMEKLGLEFQIQKGHEIPYFIYVRNYPFFS